jgi:hypothetical protein
MAINNLLSNINELIRRGYHERPLEPLYVNPVDILRLMEGFESAENHNPHRSRPTRNPVVFDASIPEPGFRY